MLLAWCWPAEHIWKVREPAGCARSHASRAEYAAEGASPRSRRGAWQLCRSPRTAARAELSGAACGARLTAMADVDVRTSPTRDGWHCVVTIREGSSQTQHEVTLSQQASD